MNLLFLHPNMPGQYKHLARAFGAEGGHRIYFITKHKTAEIPGVTRVTYAMKTPEEPPKPHRYLTSATAAVLQGQQVWRVCHALKTREGFEPDVIICHPGWGDALFVKDLFPRAKLLSYFEFYYRAHGADVGFEEKVTDDDLARVRLKNVTNLLNLEQADCGISPTAWQKSLHPAEFHPKIRVLHEGIDVAHCAPDDTVSVTVPMGRTFRKGDPVITYVARNFEPYRGFHIFMQAAEIVLKARPEVHILAVGADAVSYGRKAGGQETYREQWSKKVSLPADRIHFLPPLPYDELLNVFRISAAHLYLTYPFVLSWSMLEAMACGVALVASDTAPVREVIQDGVNGRLVDFHHPKAVAARLLETLDAADGNASLRAAARQTVEGRYNLSTLLPQQMQLVRDLAQGTLSAAPQNVAAIENMPWIWREIGA